MIFLYILGGLLVLFIIFVIVICSIVHKMYFSKRFSEDDDIKLYSFDEFEGLKRKELEISFKKGYLRGFYYFKEGYNKDKIVVYSHGMFSDHNSYLQDIAYFALKGYLVIGFDYYGTSLSDGKNLKAFGNSLESLNRVIEYIKETDELKDKEIYVVGHSWGGYATSNIVGLHPDINGICAISPFNSVYDIIRTSLPKQIRFLSWFVYLSDALHGGKFSRFKAYKSLDNYQGKAMLIQSLNDQVVKYNIGVGMIKEKTKNKNIEYIINDGRFHNPNYTDEAIKIMGKFYQESSKLSGKELQEYKRNFDFHKMGELDPLIMDKICEDIIG